MISNDTNDLLRVNFSNGVISRKVDHNWPPISCDLTPSDFFLHGHVKQKVYANNPDSSQDNKNVTHVVMEDIRQPLYNLAIKNSMKWIWFSKRDHGGHLFDVFP